MDALTVSIPIETPDGFHQGARTRLFPQFPMPDDDIMKMAELVGRISITASTIPVSTQSMQMADAGVAAATDFDWASQMRFYWRGDNETGHLKVPYAVQLESNPEAPHLAVLPVLVLLHTCWLVHNIL